LSDQFKIAVSLILNNQGVTAGLTKLGSQLTGIHKQTTGINASLNKWKLGIIAVGGVMAASGILGAYRKIAEHGKELLHQQNQLITAGRTHAQVAQLTADAYQKITKAVPTATGADVLRIANELTLVKGDFGKASAAATNSLKLEALIGNATGGNGEGQGYSIWRALEEKLVTQDEAHSDILMGKMAQAVIGSGGKITGTSWQTFARRAGVSWINANDETVSGPIPTLINSLDQRFLGSNDIRPRPQVCRTK
jgi:hypothetical protein